MKPSIEDIYRPGNSLPDAKIQKRKKKPLTASRKCAETTNNSTSTSGMTCFRLDKEKWKVPPRWQGCLRKLYVYYLIRSGQPSAHQAETPNS